MKKIIAALVLVAAGTSAALAGPIEDRQGVINESADLLYNLSVLWATLNIHPDDVFAEIRRREALYGIAEKLPKTAAER